MTPEFTVNQVAFIDDDDDLRAANVQALQLAGFEVLAFASAEAALKALGHDFPGAVVSDIRMPRMDGRQLFRKLKEEDPDLPVILVTGHADVAEAVEAMHEGAYDFVAKPYAAERLVASIRRALEKRRLVLDNRRLRAAADNAQTDWPLIGQTPVMERLRATLRQLADADVDVLLEGETGVGKELAARALHAWSRRSRFEFVAVDCAALPSAMIESELFGHELGAFQGAMRQRIGRLQHAHRGTLFLDELEALPLEAQGKFLRVLEEREVTPLGGNAVHSIDLRVVAAVKSDLAEISRRGAFREDLFHRLDVVRVRIPPLRERRDDVPLLFAHFIARAAERLRQPTPAIDDAVRWRLASHDWPGNVRELSHFAQRVVLGLDETVAEGVAGEAPPLPARVAAYEADLIKETLGQCHGDVRSALTILGIPRKTFYDKLERYGIDINRFRER
jgi:two-component system C4-dicarboxylate transport response regulator DctD